MSYIVVFSLFVLGSAFIYHRKLEDKKRQVRFKFERDEQDCKIARAYYGDRY